MNPVSRNSPCPCGSGKRYKQCCGSLTAPGAGVDPAAPSLDELLVGALRRQQSGDPRGAEPLYRQALVLAPDDPDALHMLGTVCMSLGRHEEAFPLILKAAEVTNWQWAPMRYNLGLVVTELLRRDPDGQAGAVSTERLVAVADELRRRSRVAVEHRLFDIQSPFRLPSVDDPQVSIIVPVFGKHEFTYSSLRSVAEQTAGARYEVIVVDDCSPEPVSEALSMIEGVRVLRNPVNLGFVGSCNRGATLARAAVLVFLNNDTLVTEGWLVALLSALSQPGAGLVGAKLVNADGSLQEAGCIIWRGATPSQYGRNDDPGKPEYNYLRDVDYCSGACIAIEKALFAELGGFDAAYAPAYFEDSDLAMRVRQSGRRVLYQPAARVVHFEGATAGRSLQAGVKAHQATNHARFAAQWGALCDARRRFPDRPDLEKDRDCRGRILLLDAYIPVPDQDSGSVRMVELLKLLVEARWKVSFGAISLEYRSPYAERLQQLGIEVLHAPHFFSLRELVMSRGPDMDCVLASRLDVAELALPLARKFSPSALCVFDTVDLHFVRERRAADLGGDPDARLEAERTERRERAAMRLADLTIVVSEAERELLQRIEPGVAVQVISTIHEAAVAVPGYEGRRDMLFVGGYRHPPNVDAAVWFVGEVWPLIRPRLPGARIFLVGSQMPAQVKALAGGGVEALGHVPDLDALLGRCRLALAPLRYGAGVKGKINTAQAHGVPVVGTSVSVEGMHLEPGRDVLIGDTPEAFADAVVAAYSDAELWGRLSRGGLANVERYFSRAVARAQVGLMLAAADGTRRRSGQKTVG